MKNKKLNNKGFMLVETLIVSVFTMAIFSLIYSNYYPIMAEYNRREVFDDVDGKYGVYWIKRIIQSSGVNFGNEATSGTIAYNIKNNGYHSFDCNTDISSGDKTTIYLCNNLVKKLEIVRRSDDGKELSKDDTAGKPAIYVTTFNLSDFKDKAAEKNGTGIFSGDLADYVSFLPVYDKIVSLNRAKYRVIVEYHRTKDNNDYYAYSTIEVKK